MFSAITFHDHARERGVRPILGCEVYVAPGQPPRSRRAGQRELQPSRAAGRDAAGLAQPDQAGLGRLHRGVLPKPRIDKDLLAKHAAGSSASAAASRARSRRPSRPIRPRARAGVRGDVPRHPRARRTSSSSCSGTASTSSASSTAAWRRSRATSACRWWRPTTCTTCATATTCRTTCCCASAPGKTVQRRRAAALSRRPVLPEDRRRDDAGVRRRVPGGDLQHRPHRRAVRRRSRAAPRTTSPISTCPPGYTLDDYFEHVVREGFAERLVRLRQLEPRRDRCAIRSPSTSSASRTRSK